MALDKIRPCTAAELLAYQFMQSKDLATDPISETQDQQAFIDERDEAKVEPPVKMKTYWLKREPIDTDMPPEMEESDGETIDVQPPRQQARLVRGIF